MLIVAAGEGEYTGGMNKIKGEADQRAMDLGHEYHDNDGGGMNGASGEGVDAKRLALSGPNDVPPFEEELSEAFYEGYDAAVKGQPKTSCPALCHELVTQWLRGWNEFRAGEADDGADGANGEGDGE